MGPWGGLRPRLPGALAGPRAAGGRADSPEGSLERLAVEELGVKHTESLWKELRCKES